VHVPILLHLRGPVAFNPLFVEIIFLAYQQY
jgi:hypothetical protein